MNDEWIDWPCDLYDGKVRKDGYAGKYCQDLGRYDFVHRIAWVKMYGDIPLGMHIHHKCGTKLCEEPLHLEMLPAGVHASLHSTGNTYSLGYRKATCKRGHERTPDNVWPDGACKECKRVYQRQRYHAR